MGSTVKHDPTGVMPEPRKIGRPTKYDESICGDIPEMYAEGQADVEVASALGISEATFYVWLKEHEPFLEAVKRGRQESHTWWLERGRKNLGGRDFNSTLWYMNMKNRHGWKDKHDHTSDDKPIMSGPITVTLVDPDAECG
jgi:hypothetical protein